MIASVDGRTSIDGSSSGLGHPADTALLRELRTAAEVILVGAGTLVAEGYARLLDDQQIARRVADGRAPHPTVVTISRKLNLPDIPITHEDAPFVVYSQVEGDGPGEVRTLRNVTVKPVLDDLGPVSVLCEGGPRLLRRLAEAQLLDDFVITVAPLITGGLAAGVLAGDALSDPRAFELVSVARADDHMFLHYSRSKDF
jgi:riboflavin biosynthesis pyrimidine reductase